MCSKRSTQFILYRKSLRTYKMEADTHNNVGVCFFIVSDFSRYCRKIVRLYNKIVELMLVVRYRNRSISPFHSVSIMCISKHDFAIFWHIHADNLLVLSAVSRFGVSPPYKFRKNLRETQRRSSCERA